MAPLLQRPPIGGGALLLEALLMKKTVAALVLVVLLPLSWVLFAEPGDLDAPELSRPVGPLQAASVAATEDSLKEADLGEPERAGVAAGHTPLVTLSDEDLAGATMQVVQLVDAKSLEALPGAELFVIPIDTLQNLPANGYEEIYQRMPGNYRDLFTRAGRVFRSDTDGHVTIPMPGSGVSIYARSGDQHCSTSLRVEETTQVVALAADRVVRVRAVNERRTALPGVPVALMIEDQGRFMNVSRSVTSSNGEAELVWWQGFGAELNRLVVALDFPTAEPVHVPIYESRWPEDVVTLPLPELGAVVLTTRDERSTTPIEGMSRLLVGCKGRRAGLDGRSRRAGDSSWNRARGQCAFLAGRHRRSADRTGVAAWPA